MNLSRKIHERFIGFEGPDGVNKTTFAVLTHRLLRSFGQDPLYIHLPCEYTISGELIAVQSTMAQESRPVLYAANRMEALKLANEWTESKQNRWVVWDRTHYSGITYFMAPGYIQDEAWLDQIDAHFPEVEVGIYLHRPVEESISILKQRNVDRISTDNRILDQDERLQREVRARYLRLISVRHNWQAVDVSGTDSPPHENLEWQQQKGALIWQVICQKLAKPRWLDGADNAVLKNLVRRDENNLPELIQIRDPEIWNQVGLESQVGKLELDCLRAKER